MQCTGYYKKPGICADTAIQTWNRQGFYELPAGVHDKAGESILESAQRELLEETGFGGGSWSALMELSANPALQNNITYSFLAVGVEEIGKQELDATEEISVHLVTLDELRSIVLDGRMMQSLHAAPILKYLLTQAV